MSVKRRTQLCVDDGRASNPSTTQEAFVDVSMADSPLLAVH